MVGKARIPLEWEEQAALVEWLSLNATTKGNFFSIPNEGGRSYATAARLRRQGMRSGVSDLFLAIPTKHHHGCFLELKQGRTYSDSERRTKSWLAQEQFMLHVRSLGYAADFVFGCEDAIRFITLYLRP